MRRILYAVAAVVIIPTGLVLGAGAATAQTNGNGSTIGPCTPTNNTVNLGDFNIGATLQPHLVPICLFDAGAGVTVTVNAQGVGTKTADAAGGVTTSITILSSSQLSIDDPILVTGQCGPNSVSATGPSSAAQSDVTVTGIFNVLCPGAAVVSRSGLAFTGTDILGLVGLALALVVAGVVIVQLVRRRRGAHTA